jgi:hypothetical protein
MIIMLASSFLHKVVIKERVHLTCLQVNIPQPPSFYTHTVRIPYCVPSTVLRAGMRGARP